MLKSSTHIGSKDIRPTMHINDRVLLGRITRMYIFMVVSCRSCIDKVAQHQSANTKGVLDNVLH